MKDITISESIVYIGADDKTIDLFESQYIVPNGVSYNSYVILDEKIAVMDTVDARASEEWFKNLEDALGSRTPDYLIVSHMEPDHAANVARAAEKYPDMQIVANAKTFPMMKQFFGTDFAGRSRTVAEGDTLSLGSHTLTFVMAPMVHWPEVMVTYESSEKILFSADGFGKFGALDVEEEWADEARRYYFNIVGKYGAQVQALLKKAAGLDIRMICPLHGPILKENLSDYVGRYQTWSSYAAEEQGIFVASASIHGNTKAAAEKLVEKLKAKTDLNVTFLDLTRDDMAKAVAHAFRYDRMIVCCPTYDAGLFPVMEDFIHHLKAKSYQKRTVGFVENGTWAPTAGKQMRAAFEGMKEIRLLDPTVTIRSTLNAESEAQMDALVEAILSE